MHGGLKRLDMPPLTFDQRMEELTSDLIENYGVNVNIDMTGDVTSYEVYDNQNLLKILMWGPRSMGVIQSLCGQGQEIQMTVDLCQGNQKDDIALLLAVVYQEIKITFLVVLTICVNGCVKRFTVNRVRGLPEHKGRVTCI